ncbi:nuclear pore complex protein Nup153 [Halyomorpha halys]|uniref:nuclear pore complex protein Nup153 n=1 Tax=Halyomorpha halys TaxID=286706 RepID=UPI0006D4F870|nr:nuclear pore complex protein Nup153-like [Halyomorpha halys]
MSKANNSGRTKKSHNYKPYDTSNSFVKRITAKVSEILPQSSSWVSRLFSPAPKINVREREELEEEDEEEEERQPPSKRLCFRSSESNDYTHQNNINRLSDLDRESGEISPILSSRLDTERDRAVPGPSGLHLRNFVSSTPAVRPTTYESSPKASPTFVKRTPVVDVKKNANKRSSLNLSSSSTVNSTQPSFDTFVFRNPLNKSGLRPRASLNESCFYPGETTYGGASARVLTVDQPKARVVNVTASPTLQRDTIGTSALRILKALEQFSTPVLDAKKIPVRTEGTNLRKRKPPQPYEELIFPSMPELLSLKRREVVSKPITSETEPQPSTSTAAAVMVTSAPGLSVPAVPKQVMPAPSTNTEYSLRPESTKEGHVGSIKGRQKDEELETERVPELNLPNVQLTITSLPKFDLKASTEAKFSSQKNDTVAVSQSLPKFKFSDPEILEQISSEKVIPNLQVSDFKFSEPLASIELNKKIPQSPSSQNQFPSSDNLNKINTPKMKVHSPNFKLKRKSIESIPKKEPVKIFELKKSPEMKTGSILEVFKKNNASSEKIETIKHPEKSLQCSKCKVNYDKKKGKCSCENSVESIKHSKDKASETKLEKKKSATVDNSENKNKSNSLEKGSKPTNAPLKGFEGYKKPADTWECKECFVMNKNSSDACVSCSTPKSGKPQNPVNTLTSAPAAFTFSSNGSKTDLTKTTTNFVPMVNSIKKPQGQWECNTCLVPNKVDVTSCVACSAPKPGSAPPEKPKPTFSFGIPAASNETGGFQFGSNINAQKNDSSNEKPAQFSFGSSNEEVKSSVFKFGTDQKSDSVPKTNASFPPLINSFKKSNDKWECNTCLVQNKNDVSSCVACNAPKPGSNPVEKPKPTFSFGVPNTNLASASNVQIGLNSNAQKIETSAVQPQFTFGSQPDEKKTTSPIFKFGTSESKPNNESKPTFTFMNSDKPKGSEAPKPVVTNLFSFGSNAKESKTDDTSVDDEKPLKKKVSFGKPLVSEKHISNDTNSSIFGSVISKNNDGSSNFAFPTKSPFENNSTASKEPAKEPVSNAFIFGSTEPNAVLKPPICEPSKPISFSAPPSDTVNLANNEHSNTQNIFGGSFAGFKPPETESKPFSFMGNTQSNQGGQFTFNAVAPAPAEPFGSQQPSSGMPMFNQQQQQQAPPAPSLFSQQSEPKPFVFGAPPQPQQQPPSFFTFTAAPQSTGIGAATTPAFGGFAAPSNSAPVFDPNAKPSFNFTGGATPSFSATAVPNSTGEVPEVRRVRKAVRRTTQHR